MGGVQASGRQLRGALGRAGAFGFDGAQRKRLRGVDLQGHPAAQMIQALRQCEAVNGAADQ